MTFSFYGVLSKRHFADRSGGHFADRPPGACLTRENAAGESVSPDDDRMTSRMAGRRQEWPDDTRMTPVKAMDGRDLMKDDMSGEIDPDL